MSIPIETLPAQRLQAVVQIGLVDVPEEWMVVPEGIITAHSALIESCKDSSNPYIGGHDRMVTICQSKDVPSFQQFTTWLYRGKCSLVRQFDEDDEDREDHLQDRMLELTKLYILASQITLSSLKNDIVDAFIALCTGCVVNLKALEVLQKQGLTESMLSQYIVNTLAEDLIADPNLYSSEVDWSVELRAMLGIQHWLTKALLDANYAAVRRKGKPLRACKYHEPSSGQQEDEDNNDTDSKGSRRRRGNKIPKDSEASTDSDEESELSDLESMDGFSKTSTDGMGFLTDVIPLEELQRTVQIGLPEAQDAWVTIPEGFIRAHPALEQGCLDAGNQYISLQDRKVGICRTDDVPSFRRFVTWLYFGKASLKRIMDDDDDRNQERQLELAKLYVFASRLRLDKLKDEIMDVFRPLTAQLINPDVLELLMKEDLGTSMLMRYSLDTVANDLFDDNTLWKAQKPWSVRLRSMTKGNIWLANTLLDANHEAGLRKGKPLKWQTYREPDVSPNKEAKQPSKGTGQQYLKKAWRVRASDSSETLVDESDDDLSDMEDEDFEPVVGIQK